MEKKVVNLQEIAKRLTDAFNRYGLTGYAPSGKPIMNITSLQEDHQLAVSVPFSDGKDTITMLYFPIVHEIRKVEAADLPKYHLFQYHHLKKRKLYGPYMLVEISETDDGKTVFTQCLRQLMNRPLPKTVEEAENFLNVRFLLSTEEELVERAWIPGKVLKPYVWEKTVGYCYTAKINGNTQTWLINSSCERVDGISEMMFLSTPKLLQVEQGYIYFNGKGFYPRKSKYLDKSEIRDKFAHVSKTYPQAMFYGHLIPVYDADNPYWLVGVTDERARWYILVSPETEEIKIVRDQLKIAAPNDKIFFDLLKK